ncbi:MAG: hypothetical protein NC078_06205 [Ruminococcus sp.]|nr:hypothetical protein [Ruminococcus sp.]
MKRVLFSPVGMTDPIRFYKDGAMLNVIRHYAPDSIYLYMSKEILEHHRSDNRYVYCINELAKLLGKKIDVHIIERPELEDVQLFDIFISDFSEILNNIHSEYPDDEILLNVSSGTPAMKSALMILSLTVNFVTLPIQVSTPVKQSNPRTDDEKNASPEVLWELNDSNTEQDDRCVACATENLLAEFKRQTLIKLICSYDYPAAYELAKDMNVSKRFLELLDGAAARLKLNYGKTAKIFEKYGSNIRLCADKELEAAAEYILLLDIKVKKEEYADFVRAITPVIMELFVLYMKNKCGVNVYDYTSKNKRGVYNWDMNKLKGTDVLKHLDDVYRNKGGFNAKDISSDAICGLIDKMSDDPMAKGTASKLREKIEENIRNKAAHQIVSITEEKIKRETGHSSSEIIKMLLDMLSFCGMNISKKFTAAYDGMNVLIIESL